MKKFDPEIDDSVESELVFSGRLEGAVLEKIPCVLRVSQRRSIGGIPSIIGWSIGPFFICQKLKDIIEALEPDCHHFIPIELKSLDQGDEEVSYGAYYLVSCPVLNAISIDKTKFIKGMGEAGRQASVGGLSSVDDAPCVLHANVVAGRHLWRQSPDIASTPANPKRRKSIYFCSDQLREKILAEGMDGWDIEKYCSVE